MDSPITVTVSEDESKFASTVVKLLLVGVSVALGALLGWRATSGPAVDPQVVAAQARARLMADGLREHAERTESCTSGLTAFALDAEHSLAQHRQDPWGTRWSVRCHGDLAVVQSAGADGRWDTLDDVVALGAPPRT